MKSRNSCRRRYTRGFTLVEAALSVAIVGVLLVASTGTFGALARARKSQVESRMAYLLAHQLMAEILQCYFQQQSTIPVFGPVAGQTRAQFNYVDAYNGYSSSPPVSQTGTVLAGYANWTQSVVVRYVSVASPFTSVGSSTLKQVTVIITAPSGKAYTLIGLRSQFGAYENQPSTLTNYITGVSVTLQGVSPAKTIYTGAHPLNISSSQ